MKEELNTNIKKELPGALRDAIRQHPLKKLLQEEEARIRLRASEGVSPAPPAPPEVRARVIPIWRRLAAVAAVLLVVGFSGYFGWKAFLTPPPLAVTLMEMPGSAEKANKEPEALFVKASEAFFNEEYKKAVPLLSSILKSSNRYYESQYLLAHAQHHLTNYKEAIRIYNNFLADADAYINLPPKYRNSSLRWNLALAYWGDRNKAMAQQELTRFKEEIGNNANWSKKIKTFEDELKKE